MITDSAGREQHYVNGRHVSSGRVKDKARHIRDAEAAMKGAGPISHSTLTAEEKSKLGFHADGWHPWNPATQKRERRPKPTPEPEDSNATARGEAEAKRAMHRNGFVEALREHPAPDNATRPQQAAHRVGVLRRYLEQSGGIPRDVKAELLFHAMVPDSYMSGGSRSVHDATIPDHVFGTIGLDAKHVTGQASRISSRPSKEKQKASYTGNLTLNLAFMDRPSSTSSRPVGRVVLIPGTHLATNADMIFGVGKPQQNRSVCAPLAERRRYEGMLEDVLNRSDAHRYNLPGLYLDLPPEIINQEGSLLDAVIQADPAHVANVAGQLHIGIDAIKSRFARPSMKKQIQERERRVVNTQLAKSLEDTFEVSTDALRHAESEKRAGVVEAVKKTATYQAVAEHNRRQGEMVKSARAGGPQADAIWKLHDQHAKHHEAGDTEARDRVWSEFQRLTGG